MEQVYVIGSGGISAKVLADSIAPNGARFTTFEFVFPRWILAEVNTHRMLSKGAASTRAVPVADTISMVEQNPAYPVHWGKNMPGMSSKEELDHLRLLAAHDTWREAAYKAASFARVLSSKVGINGHKQWVGRTIENFTFTKQIISGTEWENFFWLRDHLAAQPEFQELARCARKARDLSVPVHTLPDQWHLPYIVRRDNEYWVDEETQVDLETAKKISVSCCAQVSYRKLDDSIEKADKIFNMLNIGSDKDPAHATPCEHQATPMVTSSVELYQNIKFNPDTWQDGITHIRRDGSLWSGNLRGWIQYRQLIPNQAVW